MSVAWWNYVRVGQKVVCVDSAPQPNTIWDGCEALVLGRVYTIKKCFISHRGRPTVWLNEVRRSPGAIEEWGQQVGYGAWRFRPIQDTTKQVEALKRLVFPADEREGA